LLDEDSKTNMLLQQPGLIDVFIDDRNFDRQYPVHVQRKSSGHWTPLEVARSAADFLVPQKDVHILDIGSGIGKFCMAAANHKPDALFYGVEQRSDLVNYATYRSNELDLLNVFFINGNFTQIDFRQFDHFYFYNSFYENLKGTEKIDDTIEHSPALYNYYSRYLYKQLNEKPKGTRVATYHSTEEEMPACYYVVKTEFNGLLKFWIKI